MQELNFNSAVESYNYYQMNPQPSGYQYGFQCPDYYFEQEDTNPGIPICDDSGYSPEGPLIQETGVEESEAVDELLQILIECLKKTGVRTQEILLRKFFSEIEKETALETFLLERMKHSKINSLLCESLGRTPSSWEQQESDWISGTADDETGTREVDGSSEEQLERFKVKTLQVGNIVREET